MTDTLKYARYTTFETGTIREPRSTSDIVF